jgi:23S rRNA pseudouridine2604 synthase
MSQRGLCSRREADKLIEAGQVIVDGEVVHQLGIKVSSNVKIQLTEQASKEQAERLTIMINKPVAYVSGQAEDDYIPAIRLVTQENRSELDRTKIRVDYTKLQGMAPAGRLDIDSQGLLVLTQDGRIAKMLIGENSDIEKEYLVRVRGNISEAQIERLSFGLELDGKPLKRAKVRQLNEQQLQIILREGKKRQIRRMCDAVGLHVTGLKRVRVGELRLGKLEEGQWRVVKTEEFRHRGQRKSARSASRHKPKGMNRNRQANRNRKT